MKTSPEIQFVFSVLAVFALAASLFMGTESVASAQGDIGTPEHPIKIIFMPFAETQVILDGGQVMANYLNQETLLSFEVIVPSSPAATVEEMCASPDDSMGFLHGFGYVLANDLCGVDVSYKAIRYGWGFYWSEILVPRDSAIQSIADLAGLSWGFPSTESASGYMAPLVMWNDAGIMPSEMIETYGHGQAVDAVYSGEVDFATSYFSPPLKPEGELAWQPSDDPDIPVELVPECALNEDDNLYCGDWRVLDARALISESAPDVVQELRILDISPPIANDTMSFGPDFPADLRTQIENAMVAFAETEEWWDSIGWSDFYGWQGLSPATDADYNFTREIVAAPAIDIDGDNFADVYDNAPTIYNPDQSDIDSDGIGDVADLCPADQTDSCDVTNSTSVSIGTDGGELETPSGEVSIIIPAGALMTDTSISITDLGSGYILGDTHAIFGVNIGPDGKTFDEEITITMSWDDDNNDGYEDTTLQNESILFISKDGIPFTDICASELSCDTAANTFSIDVSSLSVFVLQAYIPINGPTEPVQIDEMVELSAQFYSPSSYTSTWDWGDSFTSPGTFENGEVLGYHTYQEPGVYTVRLTLENDLGEHGEITYQYIVVYDPDGGFVTGGGWIDSQEGSYVSVPSLTGKALFGFVSKYKKGADVPTGQTEFQFHVADLNFHSDVYQWLVVAGPKAQFKGTGKINGNGNYGFMVTATDEDLNPSTDVDLFRIKIWDIDIGDAIVYDNQVGVEDDADPTTEIGGGNIVIHKGK